MRVLPRPPAPPPARARQLPALTTALAVLGSTALLLLLVLLGLLCRHRARTKLGEVQSQSVLLLDLITRCVQKKYPPHPHALAQESDKQKLRFDLNPEIHSLKQ